ncbi:MAG: ComEC family competence protein [Armatimonadetes bacterium]|nr:MAG: ComEC family competence protein [Armatimonadota bacterium]
MESLRWKHFAKRPAVSLFLAFAAGGFVANGILLVFLLIPAWYLAGKWKAAALGCFVLSALRCWMLPAPAQPWPTTDPITITGTVATMPEMGISSQRFVMTTSRGPLLVYTEPSRLITLGDQLRVRLTVRNLVGPPAEYWLRRGVRQRAYATPNHAVEILAPGPTWASWAANWRKMTWDRLRRHLPYENASIAMAILFGQDRLLEDRDAEAMRSSGTYHLVATSGFNVLILIGAVMVILSHFPIPRPAQVAVGLGLLALYALAVGMNPPIVRAILMATILMSVMFFYLTPDSLSAWGVAGIVYLAVHPYAVLEPGFQLSFGVVLGLILFLPPSLHATGEWLEQRVSMPLARYVLLGLIGSLLTTLIAQLASLPIAAYHFGRISLVSPVPNLLTAPALPFIYLGAALAHLFEPFSEVLSRGFDLLLTGAFSEWIRMTNGYFGSLRFADIQFAPIPAWLAAVWFLWVPLLSRPWRYPVPDPSDETLSRLGLTR